MSPIATLFQPTDLIEQSIFDLLGLVGLTDEEKKSLAQSMMESIETRILARIIDDLKEEDLEAFHQAVDSGDARNLSQFLLGHNIDITEITAEETILYKLELTSLVKGKQAVAAV